MKIKFTSLLVLACGLLLVSSTIDLNDLFNYSEQAIPNYISKDNTPLNNEITDAGATLGRVLFYDKNLSTDNTIACASCHKQEFAFGDTALVSTGVAGVKTKLLQVLNELQRVSLATRPLPLPT